LSNTLERIREIQSNMLGVTAIDDIPTVNSHRENGLGFVYIIESKYGVKIGTAINPKRRIKQLQNASGAEFTRISLSPQCSVFKNIEKQLHKTFVCFRKIGEWFDIDYNTACKELSKFDFVVNPPKNSGWEDGELESIMNVLFPYPPTRSLSKGECWMNKAMNGLNEHEDCSICQTCSF